MKGGYNNLNILLNNLGFSLVRENDNIFHFDIISEIDTELEYIDNDIQINSKLPYFSRIYYKIKKNDVPDEEYKIYLFDIVWDRKNKQPEQYDYFKEIQLKYTTPEFFNKIVISTVKYSMTNINIDNYISLYDIFNNYYLLLRKKNYVKQKKALIRLLFLINIFYNKKMFVNIDIFENLMANSHLLDINTYLNDINTLVKDTIIPFIFRYFSNNDLYFEFNYDDKNKIKSLEFSKKSYDLLGNIDLLDMSNINDYITNYNADTNFFIKKFFEINDNMNILNISDRNIDYDMLLEEINVHNDDTIEPHKLYHLDTAKRLDVIKYIKPYTNSAYEIINPLLFSLSVVESKYKDIAIDNILRTPDNYVDDILNMIKFGNDVDNKQFKNKYMILESKRSFTSSLLNLNISSLNRGTIFTIPYFLSTTKNIRGIFDPKKIGNTFFIIVPMNEKYIIANDDLSAIPLEKEIILLPGRYTLLDSFHKDHIVEYENIFLFYESFDFNINLSDPKESLLNIYEQTHHEYNNNNFNVIDSTLPNIQFDFNNFIEKYNPSNIIGLNIKRNKNEILSDDYYLKNISPFQNIFTLESELIKSRTAGKEDFYGTIIDFDTYLYSGKKNTDFLKDPSDIYLSNLFLASTYGISADIDVRNLYTIKFNGLNSSDPLCLINLFNKYNTDKIKNYYQTATVQKKRVLEIYYGINNPDKRKDRFTFSHPKFHYDRKNIRINYDGLDYSDDKDDYSKFSVDITNDLAMASILNEIFGKHDGYISKGIFSLQHNGGVFDDEICLYNPEKLFNENKIQLVDNLIFDKDTSVINEKTLIISEAIIFLRKIFMKFKMNRLLESFQTRALFDKHISYNYNYYEKYFYNIYKNLFSVNIDTPKSIDVSDDVYDPKLHGPSGYDNFFNTTYMEYKFLKINNLLRLLADYDDTKIESYKNMAIELIRGYNINEQTEKGSSLLHLFILLPFPTAIKFLLDNGADINITDNYKFTPLHIAIIFNVSKKIIELLLDRGADINAKNIDGLTPLHLAVIHQNMNFLQNTQVRNILLSDKSALNEKDKYGNIPLHLAIINKNIDIINILVTWSININIQNSNGLTPFYKLLTYPKTDENEKILELLLVNGADVTIRHSHNINPLLLCIHNKYSFNILKKLLRAGLSPNIKDDYGELLSNYIMLTYPDESLFDLFKILIEEGNLDINQKNNNGDILLNLAIIYNKNLKLIKYLIDKTSDINILNSENLTPLQISIKHKNLGAFILLVENSLTDINIIDENSDNILNNLINLYVLSDSISDQRIYRDMANVLVTKERLNLNNINAEGNLSLHLAIKYKDEINLTAKIIQKTKNINERNAYGDSPLDLAVKNINIDFVTLLLDHGASINDKDDRGLTALHKLIVYADENLLKGALILEADILVDFIVKKGADVNIPDNDGNLPLHLALMNNRYISLFEDILEKTTDINFKNKEDNTPLHLAIIYDRINTGEDDIIIILINKGADPNIKNIYGEIPLHLAIKNKYLSERVETLIKYTSNIDAQDASGNTPLHIAIINRNQTYVDLLLDKDCNKYLKNISGRIPLQEAIMKYQFYMALRLIDVEDDNFDKFTVDFTPFKDDIIDSYLENNILGMLIRDELIDDDLNENICVLIKIFIKVGVNINHKNNQNKTVLDLIYDKFSYFIIESLYDNTDSCIIQIIMKLLKNNVNLFENITNNYLFVLLLNKYFPFITNLLSNLAFANKKIDKKIAFKKIALSSSLHQPILSTQTILIKLIKSIIDNFVNAGVIINVSFSDLNGNNVLHECIDIGDIILTQIFIDAKANVNNKNKDGNTPLHYSVYNENIEFIKLFIKHGANINAQNLEGNTPLHIAYKLGRIDIVDLLKELGANINIKNISGKIPADLRVKEKKLKLKQYGGYYKKYLKYKQKYIELKKTLKS